ncbi:ATP-binding protein [Variovorax rhizosphaerae]|uniref:ATP-binding protein n=1 Tax=Variovorax rhizosphaerae TaxID=1836200 RepID=A0ABU8WDN5_9BURK
MIKIYQVREVFTPSTPARVAFVERDSINNKLVNALRTPGKQIVVYGHSGSGKTTLLVNKLHQLYERHITTPCMKGLTFEQLVMDAFDQLSPFYISEKSAARKSTKAEELSVTYKIISAKIGDSSTLESGQKSNRLLPPQLTPQNLARFIGEADCCWVLEDFHKIDDAEKPKLSQLMKVFMDMSDTYPTLKIVALGAVDTARQVVDYDPELKNRVSEIRVDLMEEREIQEIIEKGEKALNINFGLIKNSIATYSSGLAAVCHHLCLNICDAAEVQETFKGEKPYIVPRTSLPEALKTYVQEASDSIKSSFDKALKKERKSKYNNAELIIRTLCKATDDGMARAELLGKIREGEQGFPNSNLEHYLKKLQLEEYGALLRYSPLSNCYSFTDPFYRVFAMVFFKEAKVSRHGEIVSAELIKLLEKLVQARPDDSGFGFSARVKIRPAE